MWDKDFTSNRGKGEKRGKKRKESQGKCLQHRVVGLWEWKPSQATALGIPDPQPRDSRSHKRRESRNPRFSGPPQRGRCFCQGQCVEGTQGSPCPLWGQSKATTPPLTHKAKGFGHLQCPWGHHWAPVQHSLPPRAMINLRLGNAQALPQTRGAFSQPGLSPCIPCHRCHHVPWLPPTPLELAAIDLLPLRS